MDAIRRYLDPLVAAVVIGFLVALQLAAVIGFSVSYAARAHRIAELEAALCRERVARFAPLTADVPCPEADRIFAQALPRVWRPPRR